MEADSADSFVYWALKDSEGFGYFVELILVMNYCVGVWHVINYEKVFDDFETSLESYLVSFLASGRQTCL